MNKCKWCGGDNVELYIVGRGRSLIAYYVQCNNCGMKTKEYLYESFAIDEWNNIQIKEKNKS